MKSTMYSLSALTSALVLLSGPANAQTAGKNLALDFKTTVSVQGMPDTGVIQGHAVGSSDKMRLDVTMKGSGAQVSPLASDSVVTIIVSDTGKTITYVDAKKNQFIRVRPSEMLAQAQQTGQMKMEFSGTQATVDNLGAGPTILGHPTSHYRMATAMTMSISAMGQEQSAKLSSSTDYYFANDISGALNPFASITGTDMVGMFGGTSKEFGDKMKAAQNKLPKGTPLRANSVSTIVAQGQTQVRTTHAEVTAIKWVNADPKVFEVPAGATPVQMPGMGGSTGGAIPPQ
jgi:hypothetical protein